MTGFSASVRSEAATASRQEGSTGRTPARAVKSNSRSQWNDRFRPDSGPSRGDPCRRAIRPLIGIGGRLATPPLPHHRAYGSVPRRFDRVRLGRAHRFGEDRATRNCRCVGLVGPPDVRTCARAQLVNQLRPLRQTLLRLDGVAPRSGFAWFAIAAKDTNAIFDGSTLRGL